MKVVIIELSVVVEVVVDVLIVGRGGVCDMLILRVDISQLGL